MASFDALLVVFYEI